MLAVARSATRQMPPRSVSRLALACLTVSEIAIGDLAAGEERVTEDGFVFVMSPGVSALDADTHALLQLVGGKNQSVVLNLSPGIRLPAELKVACQRIGADDVTEDLFYAETSSDDESWQRATKTKPNTTIVSVRDDKDKYSDLYFLIPAGTTKIRFVSNTATNEEYSQLAGIGG